MKKKVLATILALSMTAMLAACGGSSTSGGSASSAASGEEASTQEEETAAEAEASEEAAAETSEAEAETESGDSGDFAETPTYSFRMSAEASEGQWLAVMLQNYADDVYEATKGQVEIELYLGQSLGSADDIWNMYTSGAIEMCYGGIGHAGHFPVSDLVQTPFVCDSPEAALKVMQSLDEGGMLKEFTDYMHVFFYMPTLPQEFMFVDREVTTVEDLSGMVIRGSAAPLVSCIENLGSTPTSIPITDLYMSLSQGVADGTITSVDAADVFKLQDVVKYVLDMPISFGLGYTGINLGVWNSLPADIQEAMEEVGDRYQDIFMDENNKAGEDCIASMEAGGTTFLTPSADLIQACKDATASQVDAYIAALDSEGLDGQAIYDAALDAMN